MLGILSLNCLQFADVYGAAMKGGFIASPFNTRLKAEELIAFCKETIAGYKAPKSVEFVDSLPKNPAGKILKRELREKYWKGL